jgi:hypothetical protein
MHTQRKEKKEGYCLMECDAVQYQGAPSSETLEMIYQSTWRHISEDGNVHSHCREIHNSRKEGIACATEWITAFVHVRMYKRFYPTKEATCFFKTLVASYQAARHYDPNDCTPNIHAVRSQNLLDTA